MQHWGLTPLLQRLVGLAVVVAAAAACTHGGGPPGHPQAAGHPCTGAAPPASYEHVVTIVMENHGFTQVDGHSPFLNALARRCGLATAYHAVTHPSLPNYLAMVSGSTQGLDGSDCSPGAGCQSSGESIFSQTPWRAYAESMPGPCAQENRATTRPATTPPSISRASRPPAPRNDVPIAQLVPDLRSGDLAPYTFVTPNLCSDEHDCQISDGDRVARPLGAEDRRLARLPRGDDRALHHLRRGRPQRGEPGLHRGRRPLGSARHRRDGGLSPTTRSFAPRRSSSGCRSWAARRPRRACEPRSIWADRPVCDNCAAARMPENRRATLPPRRGKTACHRRKAVRGTGLCARARRRLPEARGLPRVGRPHRLVGDRPPGRAGRARGLRRGAQALVDQDAPRPPRAVQAPA